MSLLDKINQTLYKGVVFTVALSFAVKKSFEVYKELTKQKEEENESQKDDVIDI